MIHVITAFVIWIIALIFMLVTKLLIYFFACKKHWSLAFVRLFLRVINWTITIVRLKLVQVPIFFVHMLLISLVQLEYLFGKNCPVKMNRIFMLWHRNELSVSIPVIELIYTVFVVIRIISVIKDFLFAIFFSL